MPQNRTYLKYEGSNQANYGVSAHDATGLR